MIKFENIEVLGWRAAIRGMRNPMNSWEKSDSHFDCSEVYEYCSECPHYSDGGLYVHCGLDDTDERFTQIGINDLDLMKRLRNAGTDHRKFMRMITVYVDITAPLYWWKEFDTYKVGTVANSCSTMHKIAAKEFDRGDFSHEHILLGSDAYSDTWNIKISDMFFCVNEEDGVYLSSEDIMDYTIMALNHYREKYLATKDKKYWWQMIQLLPSSYNQKRTVMMNYEVLANIYKSRKNHKLDEWAETKLIGDHPLNMYPNKFTNGFCDWIKTLPYSELITGDFKEEKGK